MDLFFILSGFLIGSILLRSLEKSGTQNLRRFYIRRVARTFPSYYVVLTFLALTTALTATQIRHLPWEYLYGTNFLSLMRSDIIMFWGWSLALEEQFYLTVPFLFFILHRLKTDRARLILLTAVWLLALVIRLYVFLHRAPWTDLTLYEALYFRPHTRFDTLVAGIILAFVHNRWGKQVEAWLKAPFHRAPRARLARVLLAARAAVGVRQGPRPDRARIRVGHGDEPHVLRVAAPLDPRRHGRLDPSRPVAPDL